MYTRTRKRRDPSRSQSSNNLWEGVSGLRQRMIAGGGAGWLDLCESEQSLDRVPTLGLVASQQCCMFHVAATCNLAHKYSRTPNPIFPPKAAICHPTADSPQVVVRRPARVWQRSSHHPTSSTSSLLLPPLSHPAPPPPSTRLSQRSSLGLRPRIPARSDAAVLLTL